MTCDALKGLLDALIDDALTDEQRGAMRVHAATCPECASAMRAAEQLKALFDDMPPEVDVPLQAQAKWRGAIRAEAARNRRQRRVRMVGAAAAVIALVGVGLAFSLRGAPKPAAERALVAEVAQPAGGPALSQPLDDAPEAAAEFAAVSDALIEADGGAVENAAEDALTASKARAFEAEELAVNDAAAAGVAPTCELSIRVGDVGTARSRIRDLAREYDAAIDAQTLDDGGARLYVTIDSGDAADFLNAVVPMDESGADIRAPKPSEGGTVLLLLTVRGV